MPMVWEEKIKMAKEAYPALADEKAGAVVRACEEWAYFAWDEFERLRREAGEMKPGL